MKNLTTKLSNYLLLTLLLANLNSTFVYAQCDASFDAPPNLCFNDANGLDLNNLLRGDAGGTWSTTAPDGTLSNNTFIPNGLAEGFYSITYSICDDVSVTQDLLVIAPIAAFISTTNEICFGETVDFTNQSLFSNETYQWEFFDASTNTVISSAEKNPSITFEKAGNYTIQLTIACDLVETANIVVKGVPIIEATASKNTICTGEKIALTASSLENIAKYNWYDEAGDLVDSGESIEVNPTTTTMYKVVGESNIGCMGEAMVQVNIVETEIQIHPNQPSVCVGASIELATAAVAESYTWSTLDGTTMGTDATLTLSPSEATTYLLSADIQGCTFMDTVEVTIEDNLGLEIVPNQKVICSAGDKVNLTVYGAVDYNWQTHPTLSNASGNKAEASPSENTIYQVVGTDGNGCSGSATIEIVLSDLEVQLTNSPTVCSGQTVELQAEAVSSHSSKFSYEWSPSDSLSSTNEALVIANPTVTTTYTVTVTDEYDCTSEKEITVTIIDKPEIVASQDLVCEGEEVELNISGSNVEILQWLANGSLMNNSETMVSDQPTVTTTYCAIGNFAEDCSLNECITVEVAEPINVSYNISLPEICQGGTTIIRVAGADEFEWSPSTGLNTTTGQLVEASPTTTTTYTVTGRDASSCYTDSREITVTVNEQTAPSFSFVSENTRICKGKNTLLVVAGNVNEEQISWSPTTGLSKATGGEVYASPDSTTLYTITLTDDNACQTSAAILVEVAEAETDMVVQPTLPTYCLEGDSLTLSIIGNADSYTWESANGITATTGKTVNVAPSQATTYTVIADFGNCTTTTEVFVNVIEPLSTNISENMRICQGESQELEITGGDSFEWSPAESLSDPTVSNPVARPDSTTTYYVKTYDSGRGCAKTDSVTITVEQQPIIELAAEGATCQGEPFDIGAMVSLQNGFSLTTPDGQGNFANENLPDVAGSRYIPSADEVGEIEIVLTAENDCGVTERSLLLTISEGDIGTVTMNAVEEICANESADLSITTETNPDGIVVTWSGGQGVFSNEIGAATTYFPAVGETGNVTLQALIDNGCNALTETLSLDILRVSEIETVTADVYNIIQGDAVQLQAEGGTNYEWTPNTGLSCSNCDNPLASPTVTTTYSVQEAGSCGEALSLTIEVEKPKTVVLPSAFSPNGDGQNDELQLLDSEVESFQLRIFNRWGKLVFQTDDSTQTWNGTLNNTGEAVSAGVYMYALEYTFVSDNQPKLKHGTITLIR